MVFELYKRMVYVKGVVVPLIFHTYPVIKVFFCVMYYWDQIAEWANTLCLERVRNKFESPLKTKIE